MCDFHSQLIKVRYYFVSIVYQIRVSDYVLSVLAYFIGEIVVERFLDVKISSEFGHIHVYSVHWIGDGIWVPNFKFDGVIRSLGFKSTHSNPCVHSNDDKMFVLIYVDDGFVLGSTPEQCQSCIECLGNSFKLERLSLNQLLGKEVERRDGSMRLSQRRYPLEILEISQRQKRKHYHLTDLKLTAKLNDTIES